MIISNKLSTTEEERLIQVLQEPEEIHNDAYEMHPSTKKRQMSFMIK